VEPICQLQNKGHAHIGLLWIWLLLSLVYAVSASAQSCSDDVIRQNRAATIFIRVERTLKVTGQVEKSTGTGFVVSPSGYALTNRHVVKRDEKVDEIAIFGSIASPEASPLRLTVLSTNQHDVALLKFADTSITYKNVIFGKAAGVKVGDYLCSISFPADKESFFTDGRMSGTGADGGFWYTSMPSNPGDSGAPVFLPSGKVVAIKVGGYEKLQNVNLLIPINLAQDLLITVPDLSDVAASTDEAETRVEGRIFPPQNGKRVRILVEGEKGEVAADEYGRFEIVVHKKRTERARFFVWVDGKQVYDELQPLSGGVTLVLSR
jgi:S1-C subfamily serine protease